MIGDLLAQITGEGGAASSTSSQSVQPPKRKANDDLPRAPASKTLRTTSSTNGGADSNGRNGQRPAPQTTLRQSLDVRAKPSASASSHAPETSRTGHTPSKPVSSSSRPGTTPARYLPSMSSLNRNGRPTATASARPASAAAASSSSAAPKAAPKKGSYLEIMQRAKAAQAALGQVGKIQHKPLEKGPTKRERMAAQSEGTRGGTSKNGRAGKPVGGGVGGTGTSNGGRPDTSRPLSGAREARSAAHHAGRPAGGKKETAASNGRRKPGPTNGSGEEKVKKAAVATTGYQGTARPRPTSSSLAGSASRAGGAGAAGASGSRAGHHGSAGRPRMPFGGPRRSRYDDEDDDMDDFIEYDEEEEVDVGSGRRGGWASDEGGVDDYDESDMEAGMSDIDEEEQLAERVARREDAQQEALERKLKAEKEKRKQLALRR